MSRGLQNVYVQERKKNTKQMSWLQTRVEILKFESKKICESSSKKKNLSRERENADQLCYQKCLHFTETRLRSKVVVCWLPNIADFFFSLARLIEDLERQLSSASYDSSEFLFRHFDEYKRTLATLSSRFCETYGCWEIGKFTLSTLNRTGTHRFNY